MGRGVAGRPRSRCRDRRRPVRYDCDSELTVDGSPVEHLPIYYAWSGEGSGVDRDNVRCRWQWEPGDLAIWDDRSTEHRAANDHFPQRRVIRRLEIEGDRPYFDAEA